MAFPDSHELSGAFFAKRLEGLADRIVVQGEELLNDNGLDMPSRTVSLMLLIGERTRLSAADAAADLGQPHQLVTQRIELLLTMGLIERTEDPEDKRRKNVTLSAKGKDQYDRLLALLSRASRAFSGLFDEIECDLSSAVAKANAALNSRSLLDRVRHDER